MLRANTNARVKVVLSDMSGPKTGLIASDFSGSKICGYKNDGTKATISLTLGVNLFETDSTDAPGLYEFIIPSAAVDQVGSFSISLQPSATAFIGIYINEEIKDIETKVDSIAAVKPATMIATQVDVNAARDSIKGAQLLDISTIAGGASFVSNDSLHAIKTAIGSLAANTWDELQSMHNTPGTFGELMMILNSILLNRLKINKTTKKMELYAPDSTTILKTYDLFDPNGFSAYINISERAKGV